MSINVNPMADYIVVQALEAKSKTKSGFYLPDSAKETPKTAKVVAVGSAVKDVKVGDQVIYKNEYEATSVKHNSEDYTVINKSNVIATVK